MSIELALLGLGVMLAAKRSRDQNRGTVQDKKGTPRQSVNPQTGWVYSLDRMGYPHGQIDRCTSAQNVIPPMVRIGIPSQIG